MYEERDSEQLVTDIAGSSENTNADDKLSTDSKDKSNGTKQQHLNNLRTKTYVIYAIAAILAAVLISIYSYFAVRFAEELTNPSEQNWE